MESDGKSDSGSELEANVVDGKAHVEFTEEEIIAPETNTIQFKVIYTFNMHRCPKNAFENLLKHFFIHSNFNHSVNCPPAS